MTVVRCPKCGATDAGATDHFFELKQMTCRACGHQALADNEQIGEEWNLRITLPPGVTELPAFVEPLPLEDPDPAPAAPMLASPAPPPPPMPTSPAPAPSVPAPELWYESGAELSPALRCPRCGSRKVCEDSGRAERHFTFLACGDCDHGEEISSLTAASRWRPSG